MLPNLRLKIVDLFIPELIIRQKKIFMILWLRSPNRSHKINRGIRNKKKKPTTKIMLNNSFNFN